MSINGVQYGMNNFVCFKSMLTSSKYDQVTHRCICTKEMSDYLAKLFAKSFQVRGGLHIGYKHFCRLLMV